MDIRLILLGVGMIGVGIFMVIQYKKWLQKGEKDTFGSEIRLLIVGIGIIVGGIIVIVKNF